MSKITLAAAAAIGYVFGTRAGRERYEQISEKASSLWNNPKVQEQAGKAQELAKERAPKATDRISKAAGKAKGTSQDDAGGDTYQGGFDSDPMSDNAFTDTVPSGEDTHG